MIPSHLPPANPDNHLTRVLITDDSIRVRHDLRLLLELSGEMEIIAEASSGLEAVQLAAALSPDVVIMDLEMPGMDGFEATRQIKSRQLAPRVIILSVYAGPEEMELARAAGADSFVTKGASYEILVNTILARGGSTNSF